MKGPKMPSMGAQAAMSAQAAQAAKPAQLSLDTTSWGGMGPNMPQNPMAMGTPTTGQGLQAPSWMTGAFAAPWWGQQAPNVGAAMLQQQDPQAYARMAGMGPQGPQGAPPQGPAQPQMDPRQLQYLLMMANGGPRDGNRQDYQMQLQMNPNMRWGGPALQAFGRPGNLYG